jgi:hypothetical protein
MTSEKEKSARRPMSYADASDMVLWEGRQASPSNPSETFTRKAKTIRLATIVIRCTEEEKEKLQARSDDRGLSLSDLMRESLEMSLERKPRPSPQRDEVLLRAVTRAEVLLEGIARLLADRTNDGGISNRVAFNISQQLMTVDRVLSILRPVDPPVRMHTARRKAESC